MTTKILSSLKWLARKYQDCERELREAERTLVKLSKRREELIESIKSLARVIEIHEVPITVSDIMPLGKHTKRTGLPFGKITKLIYKYFGLIPLGSEVTVSEIVSFCMNETDWDDFSEDAVKKLRLAVRKRLRNLADRGNLIRTQNGKPNLEPKFKAVAMFDDTSEN